MSLFVSEPPVILNGEILKAVEDAFITIECVSKVIHIVSGRERERGAISY